MYKRAVNRSDILKYSLNSKKLNYNKFSTKEGFLRTDYFNNTYQYCYYKPLIEFNNKIICWLIFDLNTGNGFAYFNVNEGYMHLNDIDPPKIKLSDTNYIPEYVQYEFSDILAVLRQFIEFTYKQHKKLLYDFNIPKDHSRHKAQVSISALEAGREFLGVNAYHLNLTSCRGNIISKYDTANITLKFNPPRKSYKNQFKIYEKTSSLLRCEHTFYNIKRISINEDFETHLLALIEQNEEFYAVTDLMKYSFAFTSNMLFDVWYNYLKGSGSTQFTESDFAYLLSRNIYQFNEDNEALKKRLQRRKLIKMRKRGIYEPTQRMLEIKKTMKAYITNFLDMQTYEKELEQHIKKATSLFQ